ncbi:P-loop containing nucleoside triphosphate hydrolase protein [Lindgomyces ingoldianus]|uniref:P-loop containing nucleoside triphosphate hydrolase protein n=1 Tax=Lindgomyces ingoldianus TaxID=673940 RepID=A0ACB6RA10_9PLEO|nr:P-loop containing nucleoside triphosphate hydrolase protein [Lindgomyces ingoldianus]KAF2476099.1 P-loop containing nucleoside triphosphate hydrolase protein [Lindgomyces ingoldianus]
MNVFKLLSRSAKGPQTSPTQKLPSSGAVANPQLFGHDEDDRPSQVPSANKKRKRGEHTTEQFSALPIDLDFFCHGAERFKPGPKENGMDPGPVLGKRKKGSDQVVSVPGNQVGAHCAEEAYDQDECKRVLRSHKLKIVVLEGFTLQEEALSEDKKKKKKSKKREKDKEETGNKTKKNAKAQLYPQPLTSFTQLRTRYGISRGLAENLQAQGYTMPTEVQLGALPLLLGNKQEGKVGWSGSSAPGSDLGGNIDLLTIAPTGSGKTIAFLIPFISALQSESRNPSESRAQGPRAIIIAPTRELASQIVNEARKLTKGTSVKATLMKKGMEVVERSDDEAPEADSEQAKESDSNEGGTTGSESSGAISQKWKRKRRRAGMVKSAVLVATPLALLNGLKHHDNRLSKLPNIRYLVLDEADVLLDPLFREQTLSIWNACTHPSLRVGLWSATMGSNIEALAIKTLNNRWKTISSTCSELPPRAPLIRLVVGLKDTAIPNIAHKLIYAATEQGKLLGVRNLLHSTATPSTEMATSLRPPFLVFTQTIPRAVALHSELLYDIPPAAGGSSRIAVLHSDLSPSARENIMARFRRGEVWVLITTDLLARGVDFRGLNGVVNYDVPNSAAAYIHRVGRTGRAGREGGIAVTFYTQEDIPYVKNVANVIQASEKLKGKGEDEVTVKQWLLDALPTPTKRDKQLLKKRGVEARRTVKDGEGRAKMRISTKSGYERRLGNNRKGARMANRAKGREERNIQGDVSQAEPEGFRGIRHTLDKWKERAVPQTSLFSVKIAKAEVHLNISLASSRFSIASYHSHMRVIAFLKYTMRNNYMNTNITLHVVLTHIIPKLAMRPIKKSTFPKSFHIPDPRPFHSPMTNSDQTRYHYSTKDHHNTPHNFVLSHLQMKR